MKNFALALIISFISINTLAQTVDLPYNIDFDRLGQFSRSGGWSGNGGDFGEVANNIWFIGNDEISYCVKSSNSFPISSNDQINLIEKSIDQWKNFFHKYNLSEFSIGPGRRFRNARITIPERLKQGINFNFKYKENCKKSSLVFYFGVENKMINDFKKFATEHPYGFALRKSYNHSTFKNAGLVWIKEISNISKIEHTLLHELGHIMGMEHDSVYIMRESMAQELEDDSKKRIVNYIETEQWPYRFVDGSSIYLTTAKKKKRLGQKGCVIPNSFRMKKMSRLVTSLMPIGPSDCVSFNVRATQGRKPKQLKLDLKITNYTTGKSKIIKGTFGSMRKTLRAKKGPGVFTKFVVDRPRGKKTIWKKVYLDKSANNEIFGSFLNGLNAIPAKLTQEKGAILDIYIPGTDKWISLRSYNN